MKHYRIAPRAERDLDQIAAHIEVDNPDAAIRVVDAILATFQFLARHPEAGGLSHDLKRNLRVFLAHRPAQRYVILYRFQSDEIEIVAVVHGARDWTHQWKNAEESDT